MHLINRGYKERCYHLARATGPKNIQCLLAVWTCAPNTRAQRMQMAQTRGRIVSSVLKITAHRTTTSRPNEWANEERTENYLSCFHFIGHYDGCLCVCLVHVLVTMHAYSNRSNEESSFIVAVCWKVQNVRWWNKKKKILNEIRKMNARACAHTGLHQMAM